MTINSETGPVFRLVNLRSGLLFAAGLFLLWRFTAAVVDVLLLFFLAFLFAAVLNVPMRWLAVRHVPRGLSAAVIALIVLGALGALVYFAGPPIVSQAADVVQSAPQWIQHLQSRVNTLSTHYPSLQPIISGSNSESFSLVQQATSWLPQIGTYSLTILKGIAAIFIVFVLALYMAASPRPLLRGLVRAVPSPFRPQTIRALKNILEQTESWALATLILMLIVGTASGLGLWALGVAHPLVFGLIAGFGEAIPTVGPIVSALPPMALAFSDEPIKALWVALLFLGVQQVENNLLVPVIMGRSVKLHPVSILFFVLVLGTLLGLLGALLAVPFAIVTKALWEAFYLEPRSNSESLSAQSLEQDVTRILGSEADGDEAPEPNP
jgi:predicted PurR-regulated permease PerM